jgi:hypothetical protein
VKLITHLSSFDFKNASCLIEQRKKFPFLVGFEVLTVVVMKSAVFCDNAVESVESTDVSEEHIGRARNQRESRWQRSSDSGSGLKMELCFSETSVDSADYTALYPRRWYYFLVRIVSEMVLLVA